jgi:hypothetical protein
VSTLVAGVRSAAGHRPGRRSPQTPASLSTPAWPRLPDTQGSGKVAVCTKCPNMPVAGIWLRQPREKRAALGCRSASGAGEEAFGDGSDWLALDLGLEM